MLRTAPSDDVAPILLAAAAAGPTLVVVASVDKARMEAIRLRRAGLTVAVVPGEWALAAAGVDVVIGARAAAWAPCPGLAAAVVLDEHDESLQEERSPTWHARDVVVERARRAGASVLLVSPCPSVSGLAGGRRPARPPAHRGGARRLADRRGRRPQPGRAVEDVARHVGADPPPSRPRAHGRVRPQHAWPEPDPRLPQLPRAGPLRPLRCSRRRWPTTARWPAGAVGRRDRPCAWSAAPRRSPTCGPA